MSKHQKSIPFFTEREYWSSTEKGEKAAYSVTLNDGKAENAYKTSKLYVRYVKNNANEKPSSPEEVVEKTVEKPAPEKEPNGQDCVFELKSCGLILACIDLSSKLSWYEAIKYCPTGWRLPTLEELQCMGVHQKSIPSFTKSEYWSSTETGEKAAYTVTLNDRKAEKCFKTSTKYVRYVKNYE
jgi:hypothetical protein